MRYFLSLLSILILGTTLHAQTRNDNIPITRDNVTNLTLMAQLDLAEVPNDVIVFDNNEIEWSSDGEWLGIGYNSMLYVYNTNRLQNSPLEFDMTFSIEGACGGIPEQSVVKDIAFHPTRAIVAVTNEFDLHVYDLQTGAFRAIDREIFASEIQFLPDGRLLIYSSGGIEFFDIETNTTSPATGFPDTGRFMMGADGMLYTEDAQHDGLTGEETQQYDRPPCDSRGDGGGCSWIPDNDALGFGGGVFATNDPSYCIEEHLNVWDAETGDYLSELDTTSKFMAISSDGSLIVTDGDDDQLMTTIYDVQGGNLIYTIPNTDDTIDAMFNPDGSILATISGREGLVQLWTIPENLPTRAQLLDLASVVIDVECTATQTIADGALVSVGWSWYARTQDQVFDHIENANYRIVVDDVSPQRWILISQPEQYAPHGDDTWTTFFYMPIGTETLGSHQVGYNLTWDAEVSDGFGTFGPETDTDMLSGDCSYIVQ